MPLCLKNIPLHKCIITKYNKFRPPKIKYGLVWLRSCELHKKSSKKVTKCQKEFEFAVFFKFDQSLFRSGKISLWVLSSLCFCSPLIGSFWRWNKIFSEDQFQPEKRSAQRREWSTRIQAQKLHWSTLIGIKRQCLNFTYFLNNVYFVVQYIIFIIL